MDMQTQITWADWRKELRLTQEQAAFLLGITREALGLRERSNYHSWESRYAMAYLTEHPEEVTRRLKDFRRKAAAKEHLQA